MTWRFTAVFFISVLHLFLVGGCATLPTNFEKPSSFSFSDTSGTVLGRLHREEKTATPGKSGFHLLGNGLDAFVARAVLAHVAERSIDVQYYLYHDDMIGRLFTDQLLKAADRGVRIRVLVDDMDLSGRDLSAAVLDSHPNVHVRIFNPFSRKTGRMLQFITRMGSVTRRMHNKSFIVDNQAAILGGRNIGDEYFEADPDLAFADLDVLVSGNATGEVSAAFDMYWNHELSYPISALYERPLSPGEITEKLEKLDRFVEQQADSEYIRALQTSDLAEKIRNNTVSFEWGEAEVLYDHPDKIKRDFDETGYHLSPQLKPHLNELRDELIIFSPYFVPGKAGTALLTDLVRRGVRVRILTNSLASNDVWIVHAGYAKYRKALLRGGVQLYELSKMIGSEDIKKKRKVWRSNASLHAKSFVFDRQRIFIGSLNLDPRAVIHNTEIGVVVSSETIAGDMGDWFDRNIDRLAFRLELKQMEDGSEKLLWHRWIDGQMQTLDTEPFSGFWKRFGVGIMRLLPIESQL